MTQESETLLDLKPTTEKFIDEYQLDIWQTITFGGSAYIKYLNRRRRDKIGMLEGFARAVSEGRNWSELLEYPLEGLGFAEALKRADLATNNYVHFFYQTESGEVARAAMEDPQRPDHWWDHLRRNEEWFEAMMLRDTAVRHETSLPYRFFLPAIYLANRNHDLFEQINSKKDLHPELGAIFTLASYKLIAKAFGVSQEEAWYYAKAATLIVLPHSEGGGYARLPDISPKKIFEKVGSDFDRLMPEMFHTVA